MVADVRLRGNIDHTAFPVNIDSVRNILQTILSVSGPVFSVLKWSVLLSVNADNKYWPVKGPWLSERVISSP